VHDRRARYTRDIWFTHDRLRRHQVRAQRCYCFASTSCRSSSAIETSQAATKEERIRRTPRLLLSARIARLVRCCGGCLRQSASMRLAWVRRMSVDFTQPNWETDRFPGRPVARVGAQAAARSSAPAFYGLDPGAVGRRRPWGAKSIRSCSTCSRHSTGYHPGSRVPLHAGSQHHWH
jgi:hypothetical protein